MNSFRTLACSTVLAACVVGCGGNPLTTPDPYWGVVDPTAFDAKLLPQTSFTVCPNGPCYPVQQGFAHGNALYFYNMGAITGTSLKSCPGTPPLPICTDSLGQTVITTNLVKNNIQLLGPGQCSPVGTYDIVKDAYDPTVQYPIFSQLPLTVSSSAPPVIPIGWVSQITGVSGANCNDLKSAASVSKGVFGASANPTSLSNAQDFELYAAVDMTANLGARNGLPLVKEAFAWANDLQTGYLPGGKVPVVAGSPSTLTAMDGVIVDPAGSSFSKVTDGKVIIVPFAPGEAGYSPIVRLHDFRLSVGQNIGDFNDLCNSTVAPCTANQVDMAQATSSSSNPTSSTFNTLFIVAGK